MREYFQLADLCVRITKGTTPSANDGGFTDSGLNYIKSESLSYDGTVDTSKFAFISEDTNRRLRRSIIEEGDILYSIAGANLGKCGLARHEHLPANTNQAVAIIRVDREKASPRFISFCLRNPSFVQAVLGGVAQSAQPNVNLAEIGRFRIPPMPLAEQRAIAATLGALDDKIELNRRMNATLEAIARALFRDWFVDFGPTRAKMAGTAPYLSPDLWSIFPDRLDDGDKPEGWEFEAVIDQADWINGAAYKNMHFSEAPEALPVIKIAELKNGVTGNTQWTATDLGPRYLIDDGELLFSWSGNPDTSIDTFIWSGGKAWLNQHIFAVRENGKRSKPFLHAMLKFLKPDFAELARNKQTTGLGHVTKADMQRMMICNAPPAIHQAFDSAISPIFERAFTLQMESKTLAKTRDLLLPRLMSGEASVSAILAEG